jgi:NAD(P)-dependent dehydrogenase (short-subunit alcohol dehydrogenase family)
MRTLIIGANRGIGLALTKLCLEKGHEVMATTRNDRESLDLLDCQVFDQVEVTDQNSLQNLKSKVGEIDWLLHVSGILRGDNFESIEEQNLVDQFKVNSLGPLNTVSVLHSQIKAGGKIGLLTSRMGSIQDNTSGGQYGYRASKAALNAIGKSLAIDLLPKEIAVFLLHPGYVRTDMTKGNGLIDPPESAIGLFNIMQSKDLEQSGSFWHTNGEELPW